MLHFVASAEDAVAKGLPRVPLALIFIFRAALNMGEHL
jgi:hypothetical protein